MMWFLYAIFCIGFGAGMAVGENKDTPMTNSVFVTYAVVGAIVAPLAFSALVGEFLIRGTHDDHRD